MPALATDLPIYSILPTLRQTLASHHCALLQAPPGAGKTTLVPLDLLNAQWLSDQKILLLEPRRLAARSVARRMAELLNEKVGETVGWRMQLDTRVSTKTRIEVVTEGVLTRMLQTDPTLEGVGLVIFDEFHERSLVADLGLALALQSQEGYRDEATPLKILVMSATLATEEMVNFLNCPLVQSEGRSFPVSCYYRARPIAREDRRELIGQCAATIQTALNNNDGSLLAFLPGAGEIRQLAEALADSLPQNTTLHLLYGDLDKQTQDRAIQPAPADHRKIVLATAIAESSLTIEGVQIVVDAGLMRIPRFSPRSGMSHLDTIRVSRASAEQRAGRAGRLGPGYCYRLWTESEQQQLVAHSEPEIAAADLAPLALELLAWGVSEPAELAWLTQPPASAMAQAFDLLMRLGALTHAGKHNRITKHGQAMAKLGLHPRLAHMMLIAKEHNLEWLAGQLCVLLSERDPLAGQQIAGTDINLRLAVLAGQAIPGMSISKEHRNRYQQLSQQWQKRLGSPTPTDYTNDDVALLLASAYPDRVARSRSGNGRYLLSNGQGVAFRNSEPLSAEDFLVIPAVGGQSHQRESRVFLACPISIDTIETLFADQIETFDDIRWDKKEKIVVASQVEKFEALTLRSRPIRNLNPELLTQGLLTGIRELGLTVLPWDRESQQFRQRILCLRQVDDTWPDLSEQVLLNTLEQWLAPFIVGMSRLEHLNKLNLLHCLQAQLDWSRIQELDREAPDRIRVPSGSHIRIDYSKPDEPILAVKLQELFGLLESPKLAYGSIPLTIELLSPAQRPVQKTRDLRNFWHNTYQDVRKDLRGRYPKHPWPEDPLTATATPFTKNRSTNKSR